MGLWFSFSIPLRLKTTSSTVLSTRILSQTRHIPIRTFHPSISFIPSTADHNLTDSGLPPVRASYVLAYWNTNLTKVSWRQKSIATRLCDMFDWPTKTDNYSFFVESKTCSFCSFAPSYAYSTYLVGGPLSLVLLGWSFCEAICKHKISASMSSQILSCRYKLVSFPI